MISTSHLLSQVCILENGLAAEKVSRIYIPKTGTFDCLGPAQHPQRVIFSQWPPTMRYGEWGQLSIQTQEQRFTCEKICKTYKIWKICVEMMLRVLNQGEENMILNKAGFIHLRLLKETLLQLEQLRKAWFVNQNWTKGKPILNEVWDVWSSTIM